MLLRLILLLILVAAAWLLYRRFFARSARPPLPRQGEGEPYQRMVACDRCGLHVPTEEAITRAGVSYCCREHLPE